MKKYIAYFALLILVLSGFAYFQWQINQLRIKPSIAQEERQGYGMYSWNHQLFLVENRSDSFEHLSKLNVSRVFQSVDSEEFYSYDFRSFVKESYLLNIEISYLCGSPEWGLETDASSLKGEIDRIATWNETMIDDGKIEWITFDVEPYLTSEWDGQRDELMEKYLNIMIEAYQYAQSKNIKISVCIPHWLDNRYAAIVDSLIENACDEISIMNYDRNDEVANMENEVELAKKYHKEIVCIFEFQQPGKHDLEDFNTYYELGIDIARERFEELSKIFDYEGLSFAYHYYTPIVKMID